jgi:hypothetical protein
VTVALPASGAVVYATLVTQVGGAATSQTYTYTVNPSPSAAQPQLVGGPPVAKVPTSGQEMQYVYHFSGGDTTALTGVKATGVSGVNARIVSVRPGVVVIGLSVTSQVAGAARQASKSQMMTARPRAVQQGYVEFDGAWGALDAPLETSNGPTINSVSPSEITAAQGGATTFDINSPDVVTDIDGAWVQAMLSSSDGSYSETSGGGGTNYDMTVNFSTPSVAGDYCMQLVGPACVQTGNDEGQGNGCLIWVEVAGACYPITVDPAGGQPTISGIKPDIHPGASGSLEIDGQNLAGMTQPPSITGSGVTLSGASASADGTKITANYTATSSATTGSRTITVATSGGSATGTVNVSNATIQLQWFQWTALNDGNPAHGTIPYYRDSQNTDWTLDKMADEGGSQITQPTWDGGSGNGTVTENDPVAYTGGTTPAITNIILTAADGISATAKLRVATNQGAVTFPDTQIQFNNGTATLDSPTAVTAEAALPAAIANMGLELTWSVSFDQGQTWQAPGFIQTNHTMFVTLGNPMGFDGGDGLSAKPHVTAARVNYVTRLLNGSGDQDSATTVLQGSVTALFGDKGSHGTLADLYGGDPWAALDSPSQTSRLDCYNRTAIATVQVLMTGVNATLAVAFPTTDSDATAQESRNNDTQVLGYLLSDGATPNFFEAYMTLYDGGQATEAYTFLPDQGPLPPWTANVQGAPPPANGQIAFQVIYSELQWERREGAQQNSGQQWWLSNDGTNSLVQGPISFPVPIQ